jgi:hypothetical protein
VLHTDTTDVLEKRSKIDGIASAKTLLIVEQQEKEIRRTQLKSLNMNKAAIGVENKTKHFLRVKSLAICFACGTGPMKEKG